MIAEHADWSFTSIARAEEMKDTRDKAVESAANSWFRIGALRESLGEAEGRSIQLSKKCDDLRMEMEKDRADVVQRLNLGNAEMRRLAAKLNLMTRERGVFASKSEKLALEVKCLSCLADEARNFESVLRS